MSKSGRPKVRTKEAANYIGLASCTLEMDRVYPSLHIPYYKIGRAVVYDLDDLDAWVSSRPGGVRPKKGARAEQALELRKQGHSFKQIGTMLGGISRQAAHQLVESAERLKNSVDTSTR